MDHSLCHTEAVRKFCMREKKNNNKTWEVILFYLQAMT